MGAALDMTDASTATLDASLDSPEPALDADGAVPGMPDAHDLDGGSDAIDDGRCDDDSSCEEGSVCDPSLHLCVAYVAADAPLPAGGPAPPPPSCGTYGPILSTVGEDYDVQKAWDSAVAPVAVPTRSGWGAACAAITTWNGLAVKATPTRMSAGTIYSPILYGLSTVYLYTRYGCSCVFVDPACQADPNASTDFLESVYPASGGFYVAAAYERALLGRGSVLEIRKDRWANVFDALSTDPLRRYLEALGDYRGAQEGIWYRYSDQCTGKGGNPVRVPSTPDAFLGYQSGNYSVRRKGNGLCCLPKR